VSFERRADSGDVASGFTTGGEGGGGGGGFVGGGGGGGGGGDTWSDLGILGSIGGSGASDDPWDSPKAVAALTGVSAGAYKASSKAEKKALRHQAKAAYVIAREQRQGDERGLAKALARFAAPLAALKRTADYWAASDSERKAIRRALPTVAPAGIAIGSAATQGTVYRSTVPPMGGGTQRPPGPIADEALLALLETIQALREWWAQREAMKQAEREARRQRREETMSLGDTISGIGSTITAALQAATPLATAIYAERAARSMARSASGVPTADPYALAAGVPSGALSLPGAGALSAGALAALLGGQPGAMEEGGLLEALESDIEREVSLWRRSTGGQVHPVRNVLARHPQTGAIRAWEYRGQPVLYSGDLAVCKRVNKIARRSAARMGLRFRSRRRR
jgi:hypothetical protein